MSVIFFAHSSFYSSFFANLPEAVIIGGGAHDFTALSSSNFGQEFFDTAIWRFAFFFLDFSEQDDSDDDNYFKINFDFIFDFLFDFTTPGSVSQENESEDSTIRAFAYVYFGEGFRAHVFFYYWDSLEEEPEDWRYIFFEYLIYFGAALYYIPVGAAEQSIRSIQSKSTKL